MTDTADPPDPLGVIKGPHSEPARGTCQGRESTWPLKATLIEATFPSFHLRQTSGLTEKLAAAPSVLALAVSTQGPLAGAAGLAHSSRSALVAPAVCHEIVFPSAWHGMSSPRNPGPPCLSRESWLFSAASPLQNNHNHPFRNVHTMPGATPARSH